MDKINIPPDPEAMNDDRSDFARKALECFMRVTRTDLEDAVSDFLADLAHYCDRRNIHLEHELRKAESHYLEETSMEGMQQFRT